MTRPATLSELYPRRWLRWLAVAFIALAVAWAALALAGSPPWPVLGLAGLVALPVGCAATIDLDGMALAWGSRTLGGRRLDGSAQRRLGRLIGLAVSVVGLGLVIVAVVDRLPR